MKLTYFIWPLAMAGPRSQVPTAQVTRVPPGVMIQRRFIALLADAADVFKSSFEIRVELRTSLPSTPGTPTVHRSMQ